MQTVASKDGTTIAFDRSGAGPALIVVGGVLGDRAQQAPLAALLAEHFTVFNYDRRGHGESGDTAPYAVEREVEDLAALLGAAVDRRSSTGPPAVRSLPLRRRRAGWHPTSRSWRCGNLPTSWKAPGHLCPPTTGSSLTSCWLRIGAAMPSRCG